MNNPPAGVYSQHLVRNLQNLSDGDFWKKKKTAAEDGSVSDYPAE